jgi:hypothetical protein
MYQRMLPVCRQKLKLLRRHFLGASIRMRFISYFHSFLLQALTSTCYLMYKRMTSGLSPEVVTFNTDSLSSQVCCVCFFTLSCRFLTHLSFRTLRLLTLKTFSDLRRLNLYFTYTVSPRFRILDYLLPYQTLITSSTTTTT